MKKSKILAAVVMVVGVVSPPVCKSLEFNIDFDRGSVVPAELFETVKNNKTGQNDIVDYVVPKPQQVNTLNTSDSVEVNHDNSIMNSIKYCEKNNVNTSIISGLKKLLIYGTIKEKSKFAGSPEYVFPARFAKFDDIGQYSRPERFNKRVETHCWEDNCRMEKVCDRKQVCEDVFLVVCTPLELAGVFTGNMPVAAVGVVCDKVLSQTCRWVDDCADVQVCDNHCETIDVNGGTDVVNNGNIIYQ